MKHLSKEQEAVLLLFKDISAQHNSRSIGKAIGISHAGAFKIMRKLSGLGIMNGRRIGNAVVYSFDFGNPAAGKMIELALAMESLNYKRWLEEFKEIKVISLFVILFGSILVNEKEANDIDLLVVAKSRNFKQIQDIIEMRNKVSSKKIHLLLQSMQDFQKDAKLRNKAMASIIKSGVVLYGYENYMEAVR
ncbi:MAG: hypothetical protein PHO02_06370 [Candidatus Nanoarchaeia archaeon]|nr:hypothetical protein [Candidatus Nanoarchaeia archaeon]